MVTSEQDQQDDASIEAGTWVLQVDLPTDGPFGAEMAHAYESLASSINQEPGFQWKIWTEDRDTDEAGGIYCFTAQDNAKQYLTMHAGRLKNSGITDTVMFAGPGAGLTVAGTSFEALVDAVATAGTPTDVNLLSVDPPSPHVALEAYGVVHPWSAYRYTNESLLAADEGSTSRGPQTRGVDTRSAKRPQAGLWSELRWSAIMKWR